MKGAYARYEFESTTFIFSNGTWYKHGSQKVIFQWNCTDITQGNAELNVSLTYGQNMLSTLIHVNVEDRNVTLANGAYVGKTFLWLSANPAEGENVEITDGKSANITYEGFMSTCEGFQNFYRAVDGFIGGSYDSDTGLLIQSDFAQEPALLALNISEPGYYGSSGITATNIDLGPAELLPQIVTMLPFVLPIVAFIVIFALIVRRWRNRTKRKKILQKRKGFPKPSSTAPERALRFLDFVHFFEKLLLLNTFWRLASDDLDQQLAFQAVPRV